MQVPVSQTQHMHDLPTNFGGPCRYLTSNIGEKLLRFEAVWNSKLVGLKKKKVKFWHRLTCGSGFCDLAVLCRSVRIETPMPPQTILQQRVWMGMPILCIRLWWSAGPSSPCSLQVSSSLWTFWDLWPITSGSDIWVRWKFLVWYKNTFLVVEITTGVRGAGQVLPFFCVFFLLFMLCTHDSSSSKKVSLPVFSTRKLHLAKNSQTGKDSVQLEKRFGLTAVFSLPSMLLICLYVSLASGRSCGCLSGRLRFN